MPEELLTPAELAAATGKKNAAAQAAVLARRGVPFTFLGRAVKVARAVAEAHAILPQRPAGGVNFARVR
jgi:hypothetical protein